MKHGQCVAWMLSAIRTDACYLENHDTNICLGLKVTLKEYRVKLSVPTDSEPEEQGH